MIQGKIWGTTQRLFDHNGVSCDFIRVHKNYTCSIHSHSMRYNAFFVVSGKLVIEQWKNEYDLIDRTLLHSGSSCRVPAGEKHRFVALEETLALEWYWADNIRSDIFRESQGCKIDDKEISEIISNLVTLKMFPQI